MSLQDAKPATAVWLRDAAALLFVGASACAGPQQMATDSQAASDMTMQANSPAATAANAGAASKPAGMSSAMTQASAPAVTGTASAMASAGSAAMIPQPLAAGAAGMASASTPAVSSGAAGMTADAAGAASAAGAGEMPATNAEEAHTDLGMGDGSDVIAIGDSWMSLGATGIQRSLVRLSGQPYRTYGMPGTRLLNEVIPNQYESAKRVNPDIKTVIMTGGGNDLLQTGAGSDRATAGPMSRMQIDAIADRLVMLWKEMGEDKVQDVVYIEYSRGGESEAAVNYATEVIEPLCAASTPTRCHYVDSDPIIMMMLRDGIHPTDAGYDKIGMALVELMEKEGMRR